MQRTPWKSAPRRAATITAAIATAVLASAVAYAWVGVGHTTGHGTATPGQPLQSISVVGPSTIQLDLDQPVPLSGTFINGNTFTVSVARVTVTVTGISKGDGTCSIQPGVNFVTTDAVPPAGHRFTADGATPTYGTGGGDWSGATILFRGSATFDQSACLGRQLHLQYTAIAG